jgi:leucyl aminopeptidase
MVSGSSWRSGDVVRHYGGLTSEVHNTDAEGRVVLADVLAYAVAKLEPDLLIDISTLTGAGRVALGSKIAAMYAASDILARSLAEAAAGAGESVWRMPLADEYIKDVMADLGDFNNAAGNPGSITAALYLREFVGPAREKWAHFDLSYFLIAATSPSPVGMSAAAQMSLSVMDSDGRPRWMMSPPGRSNLAAAST